jgi:hypothetical protein
MIGNTYWTTGIKLNYSGDGKWSATVKFYDSGFCEYAATEGELYTRYHVGLETAIDTIITDAERMGIKWNAKQFYVVGAFDDNEKDWRLPDDWQELLTAQAKRVGYTVPCIMEQVTP